MYMSNRPLSFRHPQTNARYTRSLFWECQNDMAAELKKIDPVYSLYHDKPGLVNFRKEYVKLGDPTGYKLSQLYLEDYSHWELLMKSGWFREAKKVWDRELDARLKSEGVEAIKMLAGGIEGVSPAVQLQAAKYLANLEHRKVAKEASTRGRPSNEEVQGKLKQEAQDSKELQDDLDRITNIRSVK